MLTTSSASRGSLCGYRKGYEAGCLRTVEGEIVIHVPQVRESAGEGPYRSRLMMFPRRLSNGYLAS